MKFNFNDNRTVDSLDGVPKDFQGLYVEADGKYKLDTEDAKVKAAVSAITGLNTALVASRAEAENYKGKAVDLSALAEYGENPGTIAEVFATKLAEASKAAKGKGSDDKEAAVKSAQEAMAAKHAKDLEAHTKRNAALTSQLHNVLVLGAATTALANAKAVDVDLALPHVINQVKVEEQDGKFVVAVNNPDGTPRYSGTTGKPMGIDELVGEMKSTDKYKVLFASDAASGSGGPTTNRQQQGGGKVDKSSIGKIASGLAKR